MTAMETEVGLKEQLGLSLLTPLLVGGAVAVFFVLAVFKGLPEDADLALGRFTSSYFGTVDGYPIHSRGVFDIDQITEGWRKRGRCPVVVWLGNSQLHGINQYQEGQENAPLLVHHRFSPQGIDVLTFSPASANLIEHYVLFEFLRQKLPIKVLVWQGMFVNQRWTTVRPELQSCLEDPGSVEALQETQTGKMILARYHTQDESATGDDLAGLRDTWQETCERGINDWLGRNSTLWSLRPKIRVAFFAHLSNLRTTVFRVQPHTKRKMLKGPYGTNVQALQELLEVTAEDGIKVIVYIAPMRPTEQRPYLEEEFAQWEVDVKTLADRYGAVYADLENIIPVELWGVHEGRQLFAREQPDFWHFQASAHAILADAVNELLDSTGAAAEP